MRITYHGYSISDYFSRPVKLLERTKIFNILGVSNFNAGFKSMSIYMGLTLYKNYFFPFDWKHKWGEVYHDWRIIQEYNMDGQRWMALSFALSSCKKRRYIFYLGFWQLLSSLHSACWWNHSPLQMGCVEFRSLILSFSCELETLVLI